MPCAVTLGDEHTLSHIAILLVFQMLMQPALLKQLAQFLLHDADVVPPEWCEIWFFSLSDCECLPAWLFC